jgi:hypothetical protein
MNSTSTPVKKRIVPQLNCHMISAPRLEGETASRGQERPPPFHDPAIDTGDKRQAPGAHPRLGKPCRQPERQTRQEPQVPLRSEQAPEAG